MNLKALARSLRLAPLLTALLLGACTGTHEPEIPTLLLVGVLQGAQPQLALVEKLPTPVAGGPLFQFLDDSRRDLLAPAVALDFTRRGTDRDSAWVLMRSVAGGAASAYLQRFEVAEINPAAPSAFHAPEAPITLTLPGGEGLLSPAQTTNSSVCPTNVQSSRDGSWLLVLDVPAACSPDTSDSPVIWLVEPAEPSARPLQVTNDVLGVGPYIDQAQQDERGYFLVAGTDFAQIYATSAGSGTGEPYRALDLGADPVLLRAVAGSGGALYGLTDMELVGTDLLAAQTTTFGPVTTISSGRRLVVDPLGVSGNALVYSATQVAVHGDVRTDAQPGPQPGFDTVSFSAAAGSIDPLTNFGFLLGEGQLLVVDLLTGQAAGDEPLSRPTEVLPELRLPTGPDGRPLSVIDWLRAAEPPPTP